MRGAFGLVSLLVAVGIMLYLFAKYDIPIAREGQKTTEQVQQISGRGPDGVPVSQSIVLEPQERSGKLVSVVVTSLTPGGPMEKYYGLRPNDQITQVNGIGLDILAGTDVQQAKNFVAEAYQRSQPLLVVRDGQQITLPQPAGTPMSASPPAPSAANTPNTAAPAPGSPPAAPKPTNKPRSIREQVEDISKSMPQ